ncbi:MAG: hypothetical protein P4M01_14325 [Acidobacteriota bacterium]|nr:hypothetical protein [Acidobacteriota bacterium]
MTVRKWTIPLALAGLGGVGAVLMSGRGRKLLQRIALHSAQEAEELSAAWTEAAQRELDQLQQAVRELERNLSTHTAS